MVVVGAVRASEGVVRAAGRNLPQLVVSDLVGDYAYGCALAALLGLTLRWLPLPGRDRAYLGIAWAGKALVTLGFMLAYEWQYDSLDAYSYFRAALEPRPGVTRLVLGAGTDNVDLLTWWLARLLPDSYHAIKVAFAFAGLGAVYAFYRAACLALGEERPRLLLALAFFPSVLFWSSVLGKDPLVLLGIGVHCYGVVRWVRRRDLLAGAALGVGVLIAASVRLWLAPILLGPFAVLVVHRTRNPRLRAGLLAGGILGGGALFWFLRARLFGEALEELLTATDTLSRGWAEGGSAQQIAADLTDPRQLLLFVPRGMFTALFRPLPGEVLNAFGLLAGIESLALLALVAVAAWRTRRSELADPLTVWALLLVLVWSAVYSVLSYQNLGTAVRFRLQILPVLLGLLAWLARDRGRGAPAARL